MRRLLKGAAAALIMALGEAYAWDVPASNARMAERLAEIHRTHDFKTSFPGDADKRARFLAGLPPSATNEEAWIRQFFLAESLLRAGRPEEAAVAFASLRRQILDTQMFDGSFLIKEISSRLAISYLRQGERLNCLFNRGADSCIFPIKDGGLHKTQEAARKAIREYSDILRKNPNDLESIWLFNLCHMLVGDYPHGVAREFLIPPSAFESEYPLPRFKDIAPALGVDVLRHSGSAIIEDFDGDGFLDLLASSANTGESLVYFRNKGDGTFENKTNEAGLDGLTGGLYAVQADYNNDGAVDVFVARGAWRGNDGRHPNSLLRNDGKGHFTDVTEEAGLLDFYPTQVAAWGDFDNDGWLDLFIGNESGLGVDAPLQLFRNNKDGTFTDVAPASGISLKGYTKGASWGDFDNDGRLDLYVSFLGAPNALYHNLGAKDGGGWHFEEVGKKTGVTEPIHSFSTWWWDYDNDGWLDLFVSGPAAVDLTAVAADFLGRPVPRFVLPRLYRNRGDGTFQDVTRSARLGRALYSMGGNFGDLDNDGYLDFHVGTGGPDFRTLIPDRAFRNDGGKLFQDVTAATGLGHLQKGHGVSFGDIDNDGDQDIFHIVGGALWDDGYHAALFRNPTDGKRRWLTLRLEGVSANRKAVGSRLFLTVIEKGRSRRLFRLVGTGGSFGANSLQEEIGLGNADRVPELEIRWAGGRVETLRDIPLDRVLSIREGEGRWSVVPQARLTFADERNAAAHRH